MNRFFSVIGLACMVFVFYMCTKESVYTEPEDYLPLQVGNYWELTMRYGTVTYRVDTVEKIDNKDYFRMIATGNRPTNDTLFFRKDSQGKVYERSRTSDEILKFDFSVSVGTKWQYYPDPLWNFSQDPWNVTLLSKTDTVKCGNCTFENCYTFYYDILHAADEETHWFLAPGIGFVEYCYHGYRLKKAKINGIERTF
jgi:hypothetical protein